jgi:hypothetical protein
VPGRFGTVLENFQREGKEASPKSTDRLIQRYPTSPAVHTTELKVDHSQQWKAASTPASERVTHPMSRLGLLVALLIFAVIFVAYAFFRGLQDVRENNSPATLIWFRRFASVLGGVLGFMLGSGIGFGIGRVIDAEIGDVYFSTATLTVPLAAVAFAIAGAVYFPRMSLSLARRS